MRHEALLGKRVADRFTIRSFLGEGGMAAVYVAEQAEEPRYVALKIMNEELTADRSFVHRFQREAQAAAQVRHPSSVRIIDYGVSGGVSYIAMELLTGDDLHALLERQGALGQARAARILVEVCDALATAHEMGIVHRDLKPENIMVIADGRHPNGERVKVLDFGIAKILSDTLADERAAGFAQSSAVTRAGTFIGTPAYMSPEQCALSPVDTRADIYTCGVLLFQLVTGRLPFEGQTEHHTATLHIHEEPPRPSSFAPALDLRLEGVILKALAKKPQGRHPTARHLSEELRRLLPDLPDTPASRGPIAKRQVSAPRRLPSDRSAAPAEPEPRWPPEALGLAETWVASSEAAPPPPVRVHQDSVTSELPLRPPPTQPTPPLTAASRPERDEPTDSSRTLVRPSRPDVRQAPSDETTQPLYRRPDEPIERLQTGRPRVPTLTSEMVPPAPSAPPAGAQPASPPPAAPAHQRPFSVPDDNELTPLRTPARPDPPRAAAALKPPDDNELTPLRTPARADLPRAAAALKPPDDNELTPLRTPARPDPPPPPVNLASPFPPPPKAPSFGTTLAPMPAAPPVPTFGPAPPPVPPQASPPADEGSNRPAPFAPSSPDLRAELHFASPPGGAGLFLAFFAMTFLASAAAVTYAVLLRLGYAALLRLG